MRAVERGATEAHALAAAVVDGARVAVVTEDPVGLAVAKGVGDAGLVLAAGRDGCREREDCEGAARNSEPLSSEHHRQFSCTGRER
jgi:hypothetical protein